MRIQLRGLKIGTTPAIDEHVQRRLRFALGRFAERVGRASRGARTDRVITQNTRSLSST